MGAPTKEMVVFTIHPTAQKSLQKREDDILPYSYVGINLPAKYQFSKIYVFFFSL